MSHIGGPPSARGKAGGVNRGGCTKNEDRSQINQKVQVNEREEIVLPKTMPGPLTKWSTVHKKTHNATLVGKPTREKEKRNSEQRPPRKITLEAYFPPLDKPIMTLPINKTVLETTRYRTNRTKQQSRKGIVNPSEPRQQNQQEEKLQHRQITPDTQGKNAGNNNNVNHMLYTVG